MDQKVSTQCQTGEFQYVVRFHLPENDKDAMQEQFSASLQTLQAESKAKVAKMASEGNKAAVAVDKEVEQRAGSEKAAGAMESVLKTCKRGLSELSRCVWPARKRARAVPTS